MDVPTNLNKIALIVYGRFPTERAYGAHVFEVAKSFSDLKLETSILYSKTANKLTIDQDPQSFYGIDSKIQFKELENIDLTKYKIYEILPSFIQKIIWSFSAYFWAKKNIKHFQYYDILWSTNPNILVPLKKIKKVLIFEKHGAAKYLQRISLKILSEYSKINFIATSKKSFEELFKLNKEKTLYLPNAVDINRYKNSSKNVNETINIGYVGMLETYGVKKGVYEAFKELLKLSKNYKISLTLIGDPSDERERIENIFKSSNVTLISKPRLPLFEVAEEIKKLDIGIIPYPDEKHMNLYASPMKFFEFAASGVAIVASDIKSHKDLKQLNLGVQYFEKNNFSDFRHKIEELLKNRDQITYLSNLSERNIKNFSWEKRSKTILKFASVAQLDRASDFGSEG